MASARLSYGRICRPVSSYFSHFSGVASSNRHVLARTLVTTSCRRNGTSGEQKDESFRKGSPSQDQWEEQEHEHQIRQRILKASLKHVLEHGWTKKALEAGARDEGLPPVAHGMFPRGGAELVLFFYAKSNTELVQTLKQELENAKAEGLEKPKTKPFIKNALEVRLKMIVPYLDTWPQAMAILALPQNVPEAFSNLMKLTDDIWFYAGDRSVDFNWYTKRLALAAVYKSTEIYMIQDKSQDYTDTWAFLDNRLGNLQKFGACKKSCEQSGQVLKEAITGFSIMGCNILGLNSRNR